MPRGNLRAQEQRKRRRRALRAAGYDEVTIARMVPAPPPTPPKIRATPRRRLVAHEPAKPDVERQRQLLEEQERILAEKAAADRMWRGAELDDSKFKPTSPDKLKVGVARVTGATARAVGRRTSAMTKHDHDHLVSQ